MKTNDAKPAAHDYGLFLIRLLVAVVFIFHGSQKLFGAFGGHGIEGFAGFLASLGIPFPTANAYMAGLTEFVGGLALLSGVGVRVLALPLSFTMLVAAFTAHSGFDVLKGGNEYPLTLAFVVAGLGLTGAGNVTAFAVKRFFASSSVPAAETQAA